MSTSMRIPPKLLQDAEALLPLYQKHTDAADLLGRTLMPTDLLRAAMARGLREMQRALTVETTSGNPYAGRELGLELVDREGDEELPPEPAAEDDGYSP